ncbi:hypothetical protein GCM10027047_12070 [Rhodococcus aerolatus]
MTALVDSLTSLPALAVYLVVAALVFGEAAVFLGLVLPAETALLTAGGVAAVGHASLPVLLGVAVLAAVAGDSCGYLVGRRLGPAARSSRAGRWIGEPRWDRTQDLMERRGGVAVLTGRWVGVLRALVPAVAGMSGMPYRRYMLWNVVGGVLWVGVVTSAGYLAGAALGASTLTVVSVCGIALGVTVVGTHLLVRVLRGRLAHRPRLVAAMAPAVVSAELLAAFVVAAVNVHRGGALTGVDQPVLAWFVNHRTGWLTPVAQLVTQVGSPVGSAVAAALAAALLWRTRRRAALLLLAAVGAAGAAILVAKHAAGVARPPALTQLVVETDASFPSGHVTGSVVLYGLLAAVLATRTRSRRTRALLAAAAVLAVTITAATRLYLGVHWLSDIGGGLLLGSVVLTAAAAVTAALGSAVRSPVVHAEAGSATPVPAGPLVPAA